MASADMKARPFGRVDGSMAARHSARHGIPASSTGAFVNADHGSLMTDNRRRETADVARADAARIRAIADSGHMLDPLGRPVRVDPRVVALIAPRRRRGR